MLIRFFQSLRTAGLKVSVTEFLALLAALKAGFARVSVDELHALARTTLVKDETQFDLFDRAFAAWIDGIDIVDPGTLAGVPEEWLRAQAELVLSDEDKARIAALGGWDALMRTLEERLREQAERHQGGNRWIGTGGTSPFGNSGRNPTGMRVGGGGQRSAMAVADQRMFREYRRDVVLDVRQIDVALRGLRRLGREGAHEELDLDETVDETCKNAGELEIIFRPPRRNRVKVLLLMDVGGSMDPHSELMSRLFTAASRTGRFAKFRSFYFHNCVYNSVYEDAQFRKAVPVADLLSHSDRDEKLVMVGDALMHPAELLDPGGSTYLYSQTRASGIEWLRRLSHHFRSSAWLNPEPDRFWSGTTIEVIASVFPMYALTLDGLAQAVRYLVRGGEKPRIGDPSKWVKGLTRT